MKRLPQTLTAAVLTGALAFGGAAVAQAQMPLPASIETDGITYDKQADGSYAPRDRSENPAGENTAPILTEDQARAIWERQQSEAGENTDSELKAQLTPRTLTPRAPKKKAFLLQPPRRTQRATSGTRA